jgi:hypothetical protein
MTIKMRTTNIYGRSKYLMVQLVWPIATRPERSVLRFGLVPRFLQEFDSSKTRTEIVGQRNQNRLVQFSVLRFSSLVLTEL